MGFGDSWERALPLYCGSETTVTDSPFPFSSFLFISCSDFRHALTSTPRPCVWIRAPTIVHDCLLVGRSDFIVFPHLVPSSHCSRAPPHRIDRVRIFHLVFLSSSSPSLPDPCNIVPCVRITSAECPYSWAEFYLEHRGEVRARPGLLNKEQRPQWGRQVNFGREWRRANQCSWSTLVVLLQQ